MERHPGTLSQNKFVKMTAVRQHKLLAQWALWCQTQKLDFEIFKERYEAFHDWAELDRLKPAPWLSPEEQLIEFAHFHAQLAGWEQAGTVSETNLCWQPSFDVTLVFDQIRSPYNLGSMLRLVDNFGLAGIVHATPHLSLSHPRLVRAARGCQDWVPVDYVENLPLWLEAFEGTVVGVEADDTAIEIQSFEPQGRIALVLGNEAYGISNVIRDACDALVKIPMFGFKRSMNVGMAAAVVCHHLIGAPELGRLP